MLNDNHFQYLQKIFADYWPKATAPLLGDISLDYLPPCDSDPEDAISLSLIGLSDSSNEDVRLSLVRAPGGNSWKYPGCVALPTAPSSLTIVATSYSLGDLGVVFIPKEEVVNGRATRTVDGDTSSLNEISISYLVTADAQVTRADELVLDGMPVIQEHMESFYSTRDSEHLNKAVTSLRKLSSIVGGCRSEAHVLTCLSYTLFVRFQVLGLMEDIDSSICTQEKAIQLLPTKSVDAGNAVLRLAMLFSYRAESSWNEDDVGKARIATAGALDTPVADGVAAESDCFDSMLRYRERWVLPQPQEGFIDRAVVVHQMASIDAAITGNSSSVLCRSGRALCARFNYTGKLEDLENASDILRGGIDAASPGNPYLVEMLTLLGRALELHGKHTGNLDHLTSAVYAYERVVKLTPSPHWHRPHALHNSGVAMLNLYNQAEETETIQKAVEILELAADETPPSHALLAKIQNSLHSALVHAHQDTGDREYFQKAYNAFKALSQMSLFDTLPSIGSVFVQMGGMFIDAYQSSGDAKDLDRAIDLYRESSKYEWFSAPHSGFQIAKNLGLAKAIVMRCQDGNPSDLIEAVDILRKMDKDLPEGHVLQGAVRGTLGCALGLVSRSIVEMRSLSLHLLSTAASMPTSPLEHRFEAALHLGYLLYGQHDAATSLRAFDMVMGLVVAIGSSSGTIKSRYRLLSKVSPAFAVAAEAAFAADRMDTALAWLEQGRGIIWNQLNTLRTPLDGLRDVNPAMAQRLHDLSRKLEAGAYGGLMEGVSDLHAEANARLKLSNERDHLLKTIRTTIPGYENFLRPPSPMSYLDVLPKSGPVIVVSTSPRRCGAIALLAGLDTPFHIPLPECSFEMLGDLRRLLSDTLGRNNLRIRGDGGDGHGGDRAIRPVENARRIHNPEALTPIERVLKQLWLVLVKPIVDALALSVTPGVTPMTRIWWCPTGIALSNLPIHAAGIYRGPDAVSLMDYAVSSYIPTVSVLADRLKGLLIARASTGDKILLVSVPGAPGPSYIPNTTIEVNGVKEILESSSIGTLQLQGSTATVESVSEAVQECTSIHLACHASQDDGQPLRSGFLLDDGRLDLSTIIKLRPKNPDFAFLSACQTSTGSVKHSEEAVHLAAGLLAAGYRGVVATTWSISDRYAPKVAEDFYKDLVVRDGDIKETLDGSHEAYSLHHAVSQLRARVGTSEQGLLAWVPYVHFGL